MRPSALLPFLEVMHCCLRVDDKVEFHLADTATITGLSSKSLHNVSFTSSEYFGLALVL